MYLYFCIDLKVIRKMSFKFVLYKNQENVKEINAPLNMENLSNYRKELSVIQNDVNKYLTSLIEEDNTG